MVLGNEYGILWAGGEGGKVRKGGRAEGRCLEVNLGSKRSEAGVQIFLRISNASFDPCSSAVVKGV
jgi:hypothetical protein